MQMETKDVTSKNINKLLIILAIIIIVLLLFFIFDVSRSQSSFRLEKSEIVVTTVDGAKDNQVVIEVQVKNKKIKIKEYSFDGGKTWQKENKYVVTESQKVYIQLKDEKGNVVGNTSYDVTTIDHDGPEITVNLPNKIKKDSYIDLKAYVKVEDASRLNGEIETTPKTLDTSSLGKKQITYKAADIYGNETSITVEVEIVEELGQNTQDIPSTEGTENNATTNNKNPNNSSNGNSSQTPVPNQGSSNSVKRTYYRYRTKTVSSYECNYYNCDYVEDQKASTVVFEKSSACCTSGNCEKNNPLIPFPCLSGNRCMDSLVPKYQTSGNICYNIGYIIEDFVERTYYKKECSDGEINVEGYCHKINSVATCDTNANPSCTPKFSESSPCGGGYNPTINQPCPKETIYDRCAASMVPKYQALGNVCYDGSYIVLKVEPAHTAEKTQCDENEVNINGYCHTIDSKGTFTCPNDYVLEGTMCLKKVKKTCSQTCTTENWSEWSNWSTTKVVPTDTVEVQTKVE